jgi:quercetin dioxygenase-like cupin family protein
MTSFPWGGIVKKLILIAVLLSAGMAVAKEKAVPADQEPLHNVVLKNDYVEVMRLTIPPGRSTQWHTHANDRVVVILSEASVNEDVPGKNLTQALNASAGDVFTVANAGLPLTHRINNSGKTVFEAVDVELLQRPEGPAAEQIVIPVAEGPSFSIYRYALAPGASTSQHTHSRPYLIIAAAPMQLLMKAPDGSSMEHPLKAGDFHWIDSKVTHSLINNGKESGTIIEVELK